METQMPTVPERDSLQLRVSDVITAFCGSMLFVYIHTVIFVVWIASSGFGRDPFPFQFLTMAVSLEAIFLSTFVLISQNRQQAIADTNNKLVQDRLLQMLNDVITDEKLDLTNEEMITKLLNRIDVEHISPIIAHVDAIAQCVTRIETTLQSKAAE
jgi:uncharacterized membrane protein